MLQVAMLSGWHAHARGYAEALASMPEVKLTAVWDEDQDRGRGWAGDMEVDFVADVAALLARDDVQAVVCNAPTNRHAELMTAAANAGKHVFTEKVMALTVAECNQISEAVKKAGVKFGISFPYRTRPESLYAGQAVQEGLLGQVTFLRARIAHNAGSAGWLPPHFWDPEQTGGGAMMDLGAHPMYLLRWLGGQPKKISSSFTYMTGHKVEDNAVSVIEFEGGVLGVSETSFMSTNSPYSLELSGTEGSLVVGGPDETVRIRSNKLGKKEWLTPELPKASPSPIRMWVEHVLNDSPMPFGLEEGTQLTELMQYAYEAHKTGCAVEIPTRG
ncbi:MAG: Gfo/Idh/MocA family oxidoreductase [Candidatus Hydrogenedentes bacterium]|nr:Gfo/Idh/MocA family oxidoreductase [Candidatus Hydrogenedentota bacterium]